MVSRIAAPALALLLLCGAASAGAQETPAPKPTPDPVTQSIESAAAGAVKDFIERNIGASSNSVSGTVSYFRRFDMQVKSAALGRYRNIHLHQGTVINPRGATPSAGKFVDVTGVAEPDGTIDANVITVHGQ